ncbi:MAG: hypothetical protein ACTSUQ_05060 [Candidatus Freyarchaeota archaeon]
MDVNKSLLTYSIVFLTLEALGLFGTFFVSWQTVYYFHSANLIYQSIFGIYTTIYYIGPPVALPPLLGYWLFSRSIASPRLWIVIPVYVTLKSVLLLFKRFNLARLSIFAPLIFAAERFLYTQTISTAHPWLLFLTNTFVYAQQGLGGLTLLLLLFLGIYGVNFFENSFMFPLIKKIVKLLKEQQELELSEIAKGSGFSAKQLYSYLTKVIDQEIILAVLTPDRLVSFEKPETKELIVEAFERALQKNETLNFNDLRRVTQVSKIWFPPKREEILNIIRTAQEEGKLMALIVGDEIIRQPETGFAY